GRTGDEWMVCADGPTVSGSVKVPCTEPHEWRAVTTISIGDDGEKYPGDRLVEVTTRDYCSKSVLAWLDYPVDYEYGYTWFHDAAIADHSDVEPVSCQRPHTATTFYVGDVPNPVDQVAATQCPERLDAFIGGTTEDRRLTMLRPVWFTPTPEEIAAGAGWFRC